jgi:putative restriction endonuclease
MRYDGLSFAELSARFSSLRQAPLGDRRAPHKPLLILLMLGRYQRGNFRSLLFQEAQVQLKELLFEFGPPSRFINVLDPFWRLQNDGIWKVEDESGAGVAETVAPPTASMLVDCTARGNFVSDIAATLREQRPYISRLARELITAHFPQSLHGDICAAVGLELDDVPDDLATTQRLVREADFRPRMSIGVQ